MPFATNNRIAKPAVSATMLSLLAGCQAILPLPDNVTLTTPDSYGNAKLDTIDFSYASDHRTEFSASKFCVAENVDNPDIILADTTGSFVGAFTGTYYQNTNKTTAGGGDVFRLIDDSSSSLLANGITSYQTSAALLPLTMYVRYDLKLVLKDDSKQLKFSKIQQAQSNTGSSTNDGFFAVGNWEGAHADKVYAALSTIADKIKNCLEGTR